MSFLSNRIKFLIGTHIAAFVSGVALGKSIDAEELAAYRSVYDDSQVRLRKRMLVIGVGLTSIAMVSFGIRKMKLGYNSIKVDG